MLVTSFWAAVRRTKPLPRSSSTLRNTPSRAMRTTAWEKPTQPRGTPRKPRKPTNSRSSWIHPMTTPSRSWPSSRARRRSNFRVAQAWLKHAFHDLVETRVLTKEIPEGERGHPNDVRISFGYCFLCPDKRLIGESCCSGRNGQPGWSYKFMNRSCLQFLEDGTTQV